MVRLLTTFKLLRLKIFINECFQKMPQAKLLPENFPRKLTGEEYLNVNIFLMKKELLK